MDKLCGLIPVYNNHMTIERVINALLEYIDTVIVVDDGSDDGTEATLDHLSNESSRVIVRHHVINKGKGAAVQTGLQLADELGFVAALQVDADGQHDISDTPLFIKAHQDDPDAMIMGAPIFDHSIPAVRKYGRKLTHLVIALEAGTLKLPDAMCGFRLYPVSTIIAIGSMSSRMSFDPEVMIRAHWAGIPVKVVPTRVRYLSAEEGGVSHFRMVHDNVLNVAIHARLILQAPLRWTKRWITVKA